MSQASDDMRTAIEDIIRRSGEAERLREVLRLTREECNQWKNLAHMTLAEYSAIIWKNLAHMTLAEYKELDKA